MVDLIVGGFLIAIAVIWGISEIVARYYDRTRRGL